MSIIKLPDLRVPSNLEPGLLPDLLRFWYLGTRARRHMMMRRFREVDSELGANAHARVLDIGSAWGFNVMALGKLGFNVVGMDLVVGQFGVGSAIARENGVVFPVIGADAARLPFAAGSFDFITMVETLEHVFEEDRPEMLSECYRVLSPGGRLILSTPNYYGLVERFKRYAWKRRWLRERLPTMCYPDSGTPRDKYHPYSYHRPLPNRSIRDLLEEAGFTVTREKSFLFTLKNTPNFAFYPATAGEWLLEKIPWIRSLAATVCFVASK